MKLNWLLNRRLWPLWKLECATKKENQKTQLANIWWYIIKLVLSKPQNLPTLKFWEQLKGILLKPEWGKIIGPRQKTTSLNIIWRLRKGWPNFMSEPISRRDFLKIVGVGLGAGALIAAKVEANINPHFANGLKVVKELTTAELSRDPEKILESKKLAMVWLFAETATKYSKEMGLGGAGLGMEHFLYGNGQPLDITPLLEKVVKIEPERFVGKLVNAAITDKEDDYKRVSPEKDYQFTNRALKELKSTTGLNTALDAREWDMG